jgi:hypothetical protein
MRCVVNLLTGRFVESRGVSALPRMFEHKRGDSGEVRLEFCEGSTTATIPAGSEIIYGVKLRGEYDSAPLMTVTNFVLESGIYVGTAAFDLDAIDAALNLDADAANDLEMLDCMAEVSWKPPGGGWLSTNTQLARILNDVNRTDDSLIERIADIPARWASATLSDLGVAGPMNSGAQIVVHGLALWFVEMAGEEEPGDGYVLNEGGLTVAEVLLEFEAYINDGEPVAAGSIFVLRDGTWDDFTALIVDGELVVSTNTAGVGGNALAVSLNGAAATEVEWDGATMTGGRASKSFDSGDFIATFEREPGSELTDEEKLQARTDIGIPFVVDEDGDIVVTMELADVTGTIPDAHVLSRRGSAIVIGDGVTDGGILVEGAHNEMTIEVWANGDMKAYLIEDEMEGATYDIDGEGNYLSIGTAVTSLGDSFLLSNSFILRISIPKSVTSIGDYGCMGSALTQIKIPNSVTSIGEYCFSGCGIPTFTIPPSVTVIGEQAFADNSSLTDIYCHVTETIFGAAGDQLTGSRVAGITIHARADDSTWDSLVAAPPSSYQGHDTVTVIQDL